MYGVARHKTRLPTCIGWASINDIGELCACAFMCLYGTNLRAWCNERRQDRVCLRPRHACLWTCWFPCLIWFRMCAHAIVYYNESRVMAFSVCTLMIKWVQNHAFSLLMGPLPFSVQISFVISEIAKKEGIKVDPSEVEADIVALRQQYQVSLYSLFCLHTRMYGGGHGRPARYQFIAFFCLHACMCVCLCVWMYPETVALF